MSRHWNPKRDGWAGQWDRHRWPMERAPRRRRVAWLSGEIRLMVTVGILFGLAAALYRASPAMLDSPAGGGVTVASSASLRVIDGDTFDFAGDRIRVADIDTPERRGRCAYETELAARATTRMRALLNEGPFELHRVAGRDEDRYGRKLRIVTRGGRSLGDVLVSEGLARTWTGRREPWCV